ncbi:MAG: uroporphyrin-III C-methyltransferase [Candidatus Azotimanducaceae bacterium]|jgi:uroporphyrin-III C-methyltransferase
MKKGSVHLVGAGPGAVDLITIRALKAIKRADVIVYDRLVNKALFEFARPDCEMIYAGKRKHLHAMLQPMINQTLVQHANAGKMVVRLKGGDPFVFGRGGEEIDSLIEAGVNWQVVPGITAAVGAAAAIGLPLTHRGESQAVTLITAHKQQGQLDVDWDLILFSNQTVVIYMGLSLVGEIADELLRRGKPAATPFTLISKATQKDERAISCCLADVNNVIRTENLSSPTLLVIGPKPRAGLLQKLELVNEMAVS